MQEEPLIYTSKGNIPLSRLTCERHWDHQPDRYIKFVERYLLDGEVVKESAHVLSLQSFELGVAASS